jgi:hypothetical protein
MIWPRSTGYADEEVMGVASGQFVPRRILVPGRLLKLARKPGERKLSRGFGRERTARKR